MAVQHSRPAQSHIMIFPCCQFYCPFKNWSLFPGFEQLYSWTCFGSLADLRKLKPPIRSARGGTLERLLIYGEAPARGPTHHPFVPHCCPIRILKKDTLFKYLLKIRTLVPFPNPSIDEYCYQWEHEALPEEMLTKKQLVLFIQSRSWRKLRYSDFNTCEIPTFL